MLPIMPSVCHRAWDLTAVGSLGTSGLGVAHLCKPLMWGWRNFRWPEVLGRNWPSGDLSVLGSTQVGRNDLRQGWSEAGRSNVRRIYFTSSRKATGHSCDQQTLKLKLPIHHLESADGNMLKLIWKEGKIPSQPACQVTAQRHPLVWLITTQDLEFTIPLSKTFSFLNKLIGLENLFNMF